MTKYWSLHSPRGDDYCLTSDLPRGLRNPARPARGDSVKDSSRDVFDLHFSELRRGLLVPDVIANTFGYLLVSVALQKLLSEHVDAPIEWLPFRLIDHKGRVAANSCFVANVLGTVDCGDPSRSEGVPYPGKPGRFFTIRRLAIHENRVPSGRDLFRTETHPGVYFASERLRSLIEQHKLQVRFAEPGELLF